MDQETTKKKALLDLIREAEVSRAQAAKDWREKYHSTLGGIQDKMTSNPQDDILGPAAAAALESVKGLVADPAQDSEFAGGMPAPPSFAVAAKAVTPGWQVARKLSDSDAIAKASKAIPELPKDVTGSEARKLLEELSLGHTDALKTRLDAIRQMMNQPTIQRDVRRFEGVPAGTQPQPKIIK